MEHSPRISLYVKGLQEEAVNAAKKRGITEFSMIPTVLSRETVLYVSNVDIEVVAKWFGEPPHTAPYPVGTLLFFTFSKQE